MEKKYEYAGQHTKTFARLPGFKNLIVWQKASDLSALINEAIKHCGPGNFRLIDQMRGAMISVTANIGEGYGSASIGNYIRYCLTARGSLFELGSYLQECERWNLLQGESLEQILALYADVTFLLDRLIQSLKQKEKAGTWNKSFQIKEEQAVYEIHASPGGNDAD